MAIKHVRIEHVKEVITKLKDWQTVCKQMKKLEKADAYGMAIGLLEALIKV